MGAARNDLTQFPVIYYFHSGDKQTGFSGVLPYFAELATAASRPQMPPGIRLAGISLGGAVDDYLVFIAEAFLRLPTDDKAFIMRRYADEHLHEPMTLPRTQVRRAS